MSSDPEVLAFACPHCAGPLQVVENGDVECKHEHRFSVGEVLYRLGDSQQLQAAAAEDERTAALLQKQAQALDLTIWRMSRPPDGDGASRE